MSNTLSAGIQQCRGQRHYVRHYKTFALTVLMILQITACAPAGNTDVADGDKDDSDREFLADIDIGESDIELNIMIDLSVDSIIFQDIPIGSNAAEMISVTNTGTDTIRIFKIEFNESLLHGGFNISEGNVEPASPIDLAPGDVHRVEIEFNPTVKAEFQGNVQLITSLQPSIIKVPVTANSVATGILRGPQTINFDPIPFDQEDAIFTEFSLNAHDSLLPQAAVELIDITSSDDTTFKIGASCSDNLEFPALLFDELSCLVFLMSRDVGQHAGTLLISWRNAHTTQSLEIPLEAKIVSGKIAVSPESSIFPPTEVGSTSRIDVVIENAGGYRLKLQDVSFENTTLNIFSQSNTCQEYLQPNQHCAISILFSPDSEIQYEAILGISSDDPVSQKVLVEISGQGYISKPCTQNDTACTHWVYDYNSQNCIPEYLDTTTTCNDNLDCTLNDHCDGSGLCTGNPKICNDDIPCTSDVCNESLGGSCENPMLENWCLIEGQCFEQNTLNPQTLCSYCDSQTNPFSWSHVPDGETCESDALHCTNDICMSGICQHIADDGWCCVEAQCVADGSIHPSNQCLFCDAETKPDQWTAVSNFTPCNDADPITENDSCINGQCEGCSCSDVWENEYCGAGDCQWYEMRQVRQCAPAWCESKYRCVDMEQGDCSSPCTLLEPERVISFRGVWAASTSEVYFVGDNLTSLKWDGQQFSEVDDGISGNDVNQAWIAVHGSNANNFYLASDEGLFTKGPEFSTFNIYAQGDTCSTPYTKCYYFGEEALWVLDENSNYAALSNECGAVGDDYGELVSLVPKNSCQVFPPTTIVETGHRGPEGLWAAAENQVWIADNYINYYDGETVTTVYPVEAFWKSIHGTDSSNIFAVGQYGWIAHFNGSVWQGEQIEGDPVFRDVWVGPNRRAVAVGDHGILLFFNGVTWVRQPVPTKKSLFSVWAVDWNHVYIAGANGVIMQCAF